MGLFKDQHVKTNNNTTTTIITKGSKIIGDVEINGNLHLDGIISGKITCTNNIVIGKTGIFDGEIVSKQLFLSGKFEGRCYAKHVEILAEGQYSGFVYTDELVIAQGGHFFGESHSSEEKNLHLELVQSEKSIEL
jgi:cytoskeletal protein CcmA (bactofilin family)|tara:strand:- start:290 stop:694 length:405 start_codon:yes stop_codon:yes gene_type:complete